MRTRTLVQAVLLTALAVGTAIAPPARAGTTARYVGGGTGVVRADGQVAADNGFVACDNGDGVGSGGACLPFDGGNAVAVADDEFGENIAFQVCVDNNGDSLCTPGDTSPTCPDIVVFSHDDAGNFYNPVGPVPTGFASGCPGGPWRGYVVFLCEGGHATSSPPSAHVHPASTGTMSVTTGGEGTGTFCGGPVGKPYAMSSASNLTCGFDTVSDQSPGGQLGGQDVYNGTAVAGPWHVAGATSVSIKCDILFNGLDAGTFLDSSGVTATYNRVQIQFTAGPTDVVQVCTWVSWTSALSGSGSFEYDADPGTEGVQCPEAVRPAADVLQVPQSAV